MINTASAETPAYSQAGRLKSWWAKVVMVILPAPERGATEGAGANGGLEQEASLASI